MKFLYSESITAIINPNKINPYIFSILDIRKDEYYNLELWLEETFGKKSYRYKLTLNSVSFKNKDDAAYFKLVWME